MDKTKPIACLTDGTPGFQCDLNGTCYTYDPADKKSRKSAYSLAVKEGDTKKLKTKIAENLQSVLKLAQDKSPWRILKSVSGTNVIVFAALVPGEVDRNGDIMTEESITETCHEFMLNLTNKNVNVDHQAGTDMESAQFVESYIAPVDIPRGMDAIPAGTWMVGIKFDSETYDQILAGDYVGISIEGYGYTEPLGDDGSVIQ